MVKVDLEGTFPAPRDKLWELFRMHLDEATIKQIHPEILSDKTVSRSPSLESQGGDWVVERIVTIRGKASKMIWKYKMTPLERLRFDIVESDGPLSEGSFVDSTYDEVPGGTLISTRAEIILHGVPRFMQGWAARRLLNQIDKGDLNYFRKIKL